MISTRIKPDCEAAYRAWELRIAAAQTKAPGFQGYRFEPPIPGVQEDWLSVLRFDSEANLKSGSRRRNDNNSSKRPSRSPRNFTPASPAPASSNGPERRAGLSAARVEAKHDRPAAALSGRVPVWRLRADTAAVQGMGLPFAVALFVGNVVSIIILNYLVPWTSGRLRMVARTWHPVPSDEDRHPRNSSCERALPHAGHCILAIVLNRRPKIDSPA